MTSAEALDREPGDRVGCEACATALQSVGREAVSFLLVDHLTVPIAGCEEHRERFRAVCGLSTDAEARLLGHVPAGGIVCPGCRLAPHEPGQPLVPVEDGAVAVLACPTHQEAVLDRFGAGRRARTHFTGSL